MKLTKLALILITAGFYSCINNNTSKVIDDNIYIITTPEQLDAVRDNLSANYKLGADIDLEDYLYYGGAGYDKWGEAGWEPIGTFTGSLDGAGYKITGLWIDRPSSDNIGLFGYISNATIKSIGIESANRGIKGNYHVGGMAGYVNNGSTITNCYVIGVIRGSSYIGSMAGTVDKGSIVNNCYVYGFVSGNAYLGGVAGFINKSSIINCAALNESVTALRSTRYLGRVVGFLVVNKNNTLNNNWANRYMEISSVGVRKTLNRRDDKIDGEDCSNINASASWWTMAFPHGIGWSDTDWIFNSGQLPKLRLK